MGWLLWTFWGALVACWLMQIVRNEVEHARRMRALDDQRRKIDAEWARQWGAHLSRPIEWKGDK